MEFTRNELKILWHLKRYGPATPKSEAPKDSVVGLLSEILEIPKKSVSYALKILESKTLILRTYKRGGASAFADRHGFDPIVKVELIDPQMYLPPLPVMPLAVVVDKENTELYERTVVDPSPESIILALLSRNDELQEQITKLQNIVEEQAKEAIRREEDRRRNGNVGHLQNRIRDALTPEQWDALRHQGRR